MEMAVNAPTFTSFDIFKAIKQNKQKAFNNWLKALKNGKLSSINGE
jgi:hypothetical protein